MASACGTLSGMAAAPPSAVRTFEEEMGYISQSTPVSFAIRKGFVQNMRVPGRFYVNELLRPLMFEELQHHTQAGG